MTRYTQAIFLLIKWQYRIVANLSPLLLPAHHCIKDDIVFLPPLKCMDGSDFHVPYPGMIEPVSQVVYHTSERYDDTNPFHKDSAIDRKSTRLNSSHVAISYAVFCLKKKTITHT